MSDTPYVPSWSSPRHQTGTTDLNIGSYRIRLFLDEKAEIAPGGWYARLDIEGASDEARKVSAVKAAHVVLKEQLAEFEAQAGRMGITL